MDALHHKIFPDLLLLSPCLFQISFTTSCYQSFSLFAFLHLRNQVSQLYKTSRIMFFRLKPEKMHIKLNGTTNSKYLTFVRFFLHAGLICQYCSICEILKTKISKANILTLVYVKNKVFLIPKKNI
jgi:hypothetical protein